MDDVNFVTELHEISAITVAAASLAKLLKTLDYVITTKVYGYLTRDEMRRVQFLS